MNGDLPNQGMAVEKIIPRATARKRIRTKERARAGIMGTQSGLFIGFINPNPVDLPGNSKKIPKKSRIFSRQ